MSKIDDTRGFHFSFPNGYTVRVGYGSVAPNPVDPNDKEFLYTEIAAWGDDGENLLESTVLERVSASQINKFLAAVAAHTKGQKFEFSF